MWSGQRIKMNNQQLKTLKEKIKAQREALPKQKTWIETMAGSTKQK